MKKKEVKKGTISFHIGQICITHVDHEVTSGYLILDDNANWTWGKVHPKQSIFARGILVMPAKFVDVNTWELQGKPLVLKRKELLTQEVFMQKCHEANKLVERKIRQKAI